MNIEDIKVGKTYNVRVRVTDIINESRIVTHTDTVYAECFTTFFPEELAAFSPIPNPPKYDPCRLFREGDIVTTRARDGRSPWGTLSLCLPHESKINLSEKREYIVTRNEERGNVRIYPIIDMPGIDTTSITIDACYLELVTPVEELEPYEVKEDAVSFNVVKGVCIPAFFCKGSHPHAKAAAEAERDRLNAEYRKELK